MSKLKPEMDDTRFVFWTITGTDPNPTWDEAKQRLR
jgi:hypothetical protein